jgi:LmbE family N-acetylglucosaminyl deacetylase
LGLPLLAALATAEEPRVDRKLKVVVAGGHPDDPETGCGGTMALYSKAGHDVVALYLTRGEAGILGKTHQEAANIRTAEAGRACEILGARPILFGSKVATSQYSENRRVRKVSELEHACNCIRRRWAQPSRRIALQIRN